MHVMPMLLSRAAQARAGGRGVPSIAWAGRGLAFSREGRWRSCRRLRNLGLLHGLSALPTRLSEGSTGVPVDGTTNAMIVRPPEDVVRVQGRDQTLEELRALVRLLPERLRAQLEAHPELDTLVEVVMDLGRPALARFPGRDKELGEGGVAVSAEDLEAAMRNVGEFGGDNRAGIDRTLHRISCIRNRAGKVVGLTCRAGRAVPGSAAMVSDIIMEGRSLLMLGKPGSGKTTALREVARVLADVALKRVVIVDTSNEIGGDGDIPHSAIGRARRMQVADPSQQHRVMIEAVENHMPEVIIIDEIGTELEAAAARTIAQRGIQLVATAHGNYLENVVKNPVLSDLTGGMASVTLSDEEARRRGVQKSILEREGPPTFDVAVEMLERGVWRVHQDVATAVDDMLLGRNPAVEVRRARPDGSFEVTREVADLESGWAPDGHMALGGSHGDRDGRGARPGRDGAGGARGGAEGTRATGNGQRGPWLGAPRSGPAGTLLWSRGGDGAPGADRGVAVPASMSSESAYEAFEGALGSIPPVTKSADAMQVYLFDISRDDLAQVVDALGMASEVEVTGHLHGADAVLALRSRLKAGGWLKRAAKAAGVPIYAVKSASATALVKAVRTLVGAEPSAGGYFQTRRDGAESPTAAGEGRAVGGAGRGEDSDSEVEAVHGDEDDGDEEGEEEGEGAAGVEGAALREVAREGAAREGAAVGAGSGNGAVAGPSGPGLGEEEVVEGGAVASAADRSIPGLSAVDAMYLRVFQEVTGKLKGFGGPPRAVRDALEEARLAVEEVVVPQGQPMELLPRPGDVLEMQALLVKRELGLSYERVGEGPKARLRVLPVGAGAESNASGADEEA